MTSNIFAQFSEGAQEPIQRALNIFDIDAVTGAPMGVRAALTASKLPEDQLATVQATYPDAKMVGDRIAYTNPQTGRLTYVNPEGFDLGDIPESIGGTGEFIGGVGGAMAGTAALPGMGTVAGAGGGAVVGRGLAEKAVKLLYPTVDTRTFIDRAGDAFVTFATNSIGQKAGELIQRYAGQAVKGVGRMVGKDVDQADLVGAFAEVGAEPTAGMVTGSKTIKQLESALQNVPVTSDILDKSYQATIDSMDDYSRSLIARLQSPSDVEIAGEGITKGIKEFTAEFSAKGGALYDHLDTFVQSGTQIPTPNFNSMVNEIANKYMKDPEFTKILMPKTISMLKNATNKVEARGGMAYATWKSLRKQLAEEMKSNKGVLDDVNQADIKRLYGAISDDMGVATSQIGGDAFKAFNRANTFWRAGRSRIDDVIEPLINKSNGIKIFNSVTKGSPKEIAAMRKSLPEKQWNQVVGQVIENMGKATPGAQSASGDVFSPQTFLTAYNKISEPAKRQLFGHDPLLAKSLDSLTKVAGSIRDMAGVANTSRTAGAGLYISLLMGGLGGVEGYRRDGASGAAQGVVGGLALPYTASKLMTSKGFVNWLTQAADVAMDNPKAMGSHILRLHLISEREPEVKEEVRQYLKQLQNYSPPKDEPKKDAVK